LGSFNIGKQNADSMIFFDQWSSPSNANYIILGREFISSKICKTVAALFILSAQCPVSQAWIHSVANLENSEAESVSGMSTLGSWSMPSDYSRYWRDVTHEDHYNLSESGTQRPTSNKLQLISSSLQTVRPPVTTRILSFGKDA
jgi:hypothetical protein